MFPEPLEKNSQYNRGIKVLASGVNVVSCYMNSREHWNNFAAHGGP